MFLSMRVKYVQVVIPMETSYMLVPQVPIKNKNY